MKECNEKSELSFILDSITSRCSGNESALLPRPVSSRGVGGGGGGGGGEKVPEMEPSFIQGPCLCLNARRHKEWIDYEVGYLFSRIFLFSHILDLPSLYVV